MRTTIARIARVAIFALLLTSCGILKQPPPTTSKEIKKDSTQVIVKERVVYIPDTIRVEIPQQTAERETKDTTSFLENDYAQSTAEVSQGILKHKLETKPRPIPIPTKAQVIYKDSIVYRDRYIDRDVERIVEVERKYNAWDKLRFLGFYSMAVYLLIKHRKKILAAVRRVLKF